MRNKSGKRGIKSGYGPCLALVTGVCFAAAAETPLKAEQAISIDVDKIVGRVNSVPITELELQDEMQALYPSTGAHGGLRADALKEVRAKAFEELVVEELAYQSARRSRTIITLDKVRTEYRRIRAKYGNERFDDTLRASNLNVDEYLKRLQRRMTLNRMLQKQVVEPSRYSAAQLREYYNEHLDKFQRPGRIKARLFLAAVDEGASQLEDRKAKDKTDMVYRQLKAGKDFAPLAEKYSDDAYRVKGGDLGWIHEGRLEPDFEKIAFSLNPGETSPVFRTAYGYNIIRVENREPGRLMKFEEIRAVLKTNLEAKKFAQLREELVANLKKGARIQVLDGDVGRFEAAAAGQRALDQVR